MGSIYKRKWKDKNGTIHESDVWWIKYYSDGRPIRESSERTRESDAKKLLKIREADVVKGLPVTPRTTRITFQELADDMVNDYKINGQRSLDDLVTRLKRHILPVFGTRRANSITTPDVREYIAARQEVGASTGQINRELTAIKRAYNLAAESAKILLKPHIPMLKENNTRRGFFERNQFEAVRHALGNHLQPIVTFAYITGWRIPSEVLKLKWAQVDFLAGEIRLYAGTTKNDDGRVFPLIDELRSLLEKQYADTQQVIREKGMVCPWVFHRKGKPIGSFYKAWKRACHLAGLPCTIHVKRDKMGEILRCKEGKKKGQPIIDKIEAENIPHDFRRTAVRNLVRKGIPERVAMLMTGHKTRSVFERYNIVSPGDLLEAARKLNAGTVPGTVAPTSGSATITTSANLLESKDGPVAQLDRAAVS